MMLLKRKKRFPGTLPEIMTYPVPLDEGCTLTHPSGLNYIILGKTGAGKIFHVSYWEMLMKNRVIKVEGYK